MEHALGMLVKISYSMSETQLALELSPFSVDPIRWNAAPLTCEEKQQP